MASLSAPLAWASAKFISEQINAFTLFATHYFELTALADELTNAANVHLDATEHGKQLVFMHAVKEGPANQSYGLQVAALAGVPEPVIDSARDYLHALEKEALPGLVTNAVQTEFALIPPASPPDVRAAELEKLDPDNMTPREALAALYRLKQRQQD